MTAVTTLENESLRPESALVLRAGHYKGDFLDGREEVLWGKARAMSAMLSR